MNASPRPRHGRLLRSSPWARCGISLALGVIVLAGVLAAILAAAGYHASSDLGARLAGTDAVVVWGHGLESADAAAARASEIVAALPGVTSVTPLDPSRDDALAARVLGAPSQTVANVRLLTVEATAPGRSLAAEIARRLAADNLPARVADRSGRNSGGGRFAGGLALATMLGPFIAIAAFALACYGEGRREVIKSHTTVELMRISGATDGYMANLVRARVAALALTAALWGVAGALVAAAIASRTAIAGPYGELTRADLLSPWPLVVLAALALGAVGAWLGASARIKTTS